MPCHQRGTRLLAVLLLSILIAAPASAQYLALSPLQEAANGSYTPQELRDACFNMNLWSTVKAHTDYLGDADWAVDRMSNAEQQACFANMASAGLLLQLEVGALKSHCQSATACFQGQIGGFNRMLANGWFYR
jgi:type II secretory pathway component PulK